MIKAGLAGMEVYYRDYDAGRSSRRWPRQRQALRPPAPRRQRLPRPQQPGRARARRHPSAGQRREGLPGERAAVGTDRGAELDDRARRARPSAPATQRSRPTCAAAAATRRSARAAWSRRRSAPAAATAPTSAPCPPSTSRRSIFARGAGGGAGQRRRRRGGLGLRLLPRLPRALPRHLHRPRHRLGRQRVGQPSRPTASAASASSFAPSWASRSPSSSTGP